MRKAIAFGLILLVEIMLIPWLGWAYVESGSGSILSLLIVACILTLITSIGAIAMLMDKPKKKDNSENCPYFIEKYNDLYNPEYIDRNLNDEK